MQGPSLGRNNTQEVHPCPPDPTCLHAHTLTTIRAAYAEECYLLQMQYCTLTNTAHLSTDRFQEPIYNNPNILSAKAKLGCPLCLDFLCFWFNSNENVNINATLQLILTKYTSS